MDARRYFPAREADAARDAVEALARAAAEVGGMIWATRRHVHVDRTACAWLIRRFVDSDAEFVFVDDPDEVPADATPFDMRGVELGHRDGRCSFESILARYQPAATPRSGGSAGSCTRRTSAMSATTRPRRPAWTR